VHTKGHGIGMPEKGIAEGVGHPFLKTSPSGKLG